MIQWFRGELEGNYLGQEQPAAGAPRYRVHLYRAAVRKVTLIEPPSMTHASSQGDTEFSQASIDDCSVMGVRGPGSIFRGPIFDVVLSAFELSHPVKHEGRAYGRLVGTVVAWCELPQEAERPLPLPTTTIAADDQRTEPETPRARAGELSFEEPEEVEEAARESSAAPTITVTANPSPGARATTGPSGTTLYVLAVAVALGLGVGCSIEPALLWCAFLLPTLLARSLFLGVLRDSTGVRAFGALLILAQLVAVSTLVSHWWPSSCRELELLPLLGIVAVLFPAGLLPSALPLSCNGLGLALVLGLWCSAPASACRARDEARPVSAAPTVKEPGVPRTNQDGSWPKRPPG